MYPANEGWTLKKAAPRHAVTSLSSATISALTKAQQFAICEGVRPKCEKAWEERLNVTLSAQMWGKIWSTVSNPIANDDDCRVWFKLIHRALYVRSKQPATADHTCRLGCGEIESQLHLVHCKFCKPIWGNAFKLMKDAGMQEPSKRTLAIVLGRWNAEDVGHDLELALLRMTWRELYDALSKAELEGAQFCQHQIWYRTLNRMRRALVSHAMQVQILHASRKYTEKTSEIAQEDAQKYSALLQMDTKGEYTVSAVLDGEIKRAMASAHRLEELRRGRQQPQPRPHAT